MSCLQKLVKPASIAAASPLRRRCRWHPRPLLPLLALTVLLSTPAVQAGSMAAAAAELLLGASRWNPSWAGGSFWSSRPWVWGWYRSDPAAWAWWAARSVAWGVTSLAAAETLTAIVHQAIATESSVIAVPQTGLYLDIGSLQAQRPMGLRFAWADADGPWQQSLADCQAGLLDGAAPQDLAQAQLLNAACHVGYAAP